MFLGAEQFMSIIFSFRQGEGTQEVWRLSSPFNAGEAGIGWHKPYDFGSIMRKNGRRFALLIFFKKEGVRPLFTRKGGWYYGRSHFIFGSIITFCNNHLHNNKKITAHIDPWRLFLAINQGQTVYPVTPCIYIISVKSRFVNTRRTGLFCRIGCLQKRKYVIK